MNETSNILPTLPSGEELEAAMHKVFLPEDEWQDADIEKDWLDPRDEWERAKNSLYIGDAPVCTLGGVTILTGQSGNGKTMTLAMMMASVFRGLYGQFRKGEDIENPTVLYVDTEMEKYNTQRLMNRVYYLNSWEFKTIKPEFKVLRLRDTVSVVDRWKKVLKAIYQVQPTFCFLDGLLDLVNDFNDNVECQSLIYKLMAAASWYDMSVIGVIHQNPGGDKMAGHLGSFGERKAITVLATKKDKTGTDVLFVVEQKKARDKDAEDVKFKVNDDKMHIGIPEPLTIEPEPETPEINLPNVLMNIIPHEGITTRDLLLSIKKEMSCGTTKAQNYIWDAEKDKIILRDEHKRYFLNPDNDEGEIFVPNNNNDDVPY